MNQKRWFRTSSTLRSVIHGHHVEIRCGSLGGELVLVDGRRVSSMRCNATGRSHTFDLLDEHGTIRAVDVRCRFRNDFNTASLEALISVDGQVRALLTPVKDEGLAPTCCHNCGYDLEGLPITCGERRCPECGRHTAVREEARAHRES